LSSRYTNATGWIYLTGMQALVRLPLQQRQLDAARGWNTGGYISGYRGSPLGRYDMELWQVQDSLQAANIVFRAGLNEELAATAIWGSQFVGLFPGAKVEGVFGIWYGKGPGVDRAADALRHANLAGTSPKGGALCIAGDDHGAKSSTVANFSDPLLVSLGIPVLYPANTQEILDFGLHGIAMSRFSGCWVGLKLVTDVAEGGGSVYVGPDSPSIVLPEAPTAPGEGDGGGYHIRPLDLPLAQERRLYEHKHVAVLAYARANGLNRLSGNKAEAHVGIAAAGKAWQDVLQALSNLGIDEQRAEAMGLRLLKIGLVWPLDPVIVREFAEGLKTIVVVEEKRPLLEDQLRNILYGHPSAPSIIGKHTNGSLFDPQRGPAVFPNAAELSPDQIAKALATVLARELPGFANVVDTPASLAAPAAAPGAGAVRTPGFCSGCPHSRSTRVPEGSRALAGIGCHTMAILVDPTSTSMPSQMGGEGIHWLGQQPFTNEKHVFANLGDGTFAHSGLLAIRQAVAAHVPITYKLLYNGFVSMTGGQPVDASLSPQQTLAVLAGEGVQKMAVVTDEVEKYAGMVLPPGVKVHARQEMDAVMREFREYADVSVILYDQPCATERRRLRKRGKWPDPQKRTFINAAVCEGCGDCGQVSGCMSIEPLETELGRKRRINQSTCNKDFSCIEGFCPSFVTVHGGRLRKSRSTDGPTGVSAPVWTDALPEPAVPALEGRHTVLVAGIGGTGVVTIGQTLAMAAHLEGGFSSNLDVTGLSQKYGAVHSHVTMASRPELLRSTRIAAGDGDTLIGCDLIVAAGDETFSKLRSQRSGAVVCSDLTPTSDFARNPDWLVDAKALEDRLRATLGERLLLLEGQRLAVALLGDAIASNMFMLGAAWQRGLVPLRLSSIHRAIELNGVAIEMNKAAFLWGRRAAHDLAAVERWVARLAARQVVQFIPRARRSVDDIVEHRRAHLVAHTGQHLADRYLALVERVRKAEKPLSSDALTRAVAHNYHRVLATKDEFEVARLYSAPEFRASLAETFEGDYKVHMHLGGGPFARIDPTGKPVKTEVGPWMLRAMRLLASARRLRGTWLDPFRHNAERRLDRALLAQYEADIEALLPELSKDSLSLAVRIASLPESVRGYGHVKAAQAAKADKARQSLLADIRRVTDVPAARSSQPVHT
jgi:indolepyruvate ferredoxin oxidoreductase